MSQTDTDTPLPVELTKDELWAIRWAINDQVDGGHAEHPTVQNALKTLRGLLARTIVKELISMPDPTSSALTVAQLDKIAYAMLVQEIKLRRLNDELAAAEFELPDILTTGCFEFVLDLYGVPPDTTHTAGEYDDETGELLDDADIYSRDWWYSVLHFLLVPGKISIDKMIEVMKDPAPHDAELAQLFLAEGIQVSTREGD